MNHRLFGIILLILVIVGMAAQYLIFHSWIIGICGNQVYCLDYSTYIGVGEPLYWGLPWLLPLCLIVIFVRREVFNAWWKVILPLAIIALFIIINTPYEYQGITFYLLDRTQVTERMVWLIDLVSAIVIIWKYWRIWRMGKKNT